MSAAAADFVLDANYEGPHAEDAEYFAPGVTPVAGQGAPFRAMQEGEEAGLDLPGLVSRPRTDTAIINARVKELAALEVTGVIRIKATGELYTLMAEPERFDPAKREWTCQTSLTGKLEA